MEKTLDAGLLIRYLSVVQTDFPLLILTSPSELVKIRRGKSVWIRLMALFKIKIPQAEWQTKIQDDQCCTLTVVTVLQYTFSGDSQL